MALVIANQTLRKMFGYQQSGIYRDSNVLVGIDIVLSESLLLPVEISRKPVQGGKYIADNIVLGDAEVAVKCIAKDVGIGNVTFSDKLAVIETIRKSRALFDYYGAYGMLRGCFFSSPIVVDTDATTSGALFFSTTIMQVEVINTTTSTVNINSSAASTGQTKTEQQKNAKAVNKGNVQTVTPPKSAAAKIVGMVGGAL